MDVERFGGLFLAGSRFSAVDAFYAPVVFRFHSYQIELSEASSAYVQRMLNLSSMKSWYEDAIKESYLDSSHEEDIGRFGHIISDARLK